MENHKNILIYKLGNIGDIVCAVPSFLAIRRFYPKAKITLLTSPGKKGNVGAQDFLQNAWYFDEFINYFSEEIDSWAYRKLFIKTLRKKKFDLFIQLPDDWTRCRTMVRNMIFAKYIGASSAFGFKIRTINLFKKTQIDFSHLEENEVQNLLGILKNNGIFVQKIEFDLPVSDCIKKELELELKNKFNLNKDFIIGICPGGKGDEKKWPPERFGEIAQFLKENYGAKIIIFGGNDDKQEIKIITSFINNLNSWHSLVGCDILKSITALSFCQFLVTNDTGIMHVAAALSVPIVAVFSSKSVYGKWFPYGEKNRVLYHRFIGCDYTDKSCIKKSIEAVSIEEVKDACDDIINNINNRVLQER